MNQCSLLGENRTVKCHEKGFTAVNGIIVNQYSEVQYGEVQYSEVKYSEVQYSEVNYSEVQYSGRKQNCKVSQKGFTAVN